MRNRYSRHACILRAAGAPWAAALLLLASSSCSKPAATSPVVTAPAAPATAPSTRATEAGDDTRAIAAEEARQVASLVQNRHPEIAVSTDEKRVRSHLWQRIDRGQVWGLAALVTTDGPWSETAWYPWVQETFADAVARKGLTHGDAPPGVLAAAMRKLEDLRAPREARVNAAIALRFDDPEGSKEILLREYGTFGVSPFLDVVGASTTPCGSFLRELKVQVPDEIGMIDVSNILGLPTTDKFGADVANEGNAELHRLASEGRYDDLKALLSRGEMTAFVKRVGRRVKDHPPPPFTHHLFGSGESEQSEAVSTTRPATSQSSP